MLELVIYGRPDCHLCDEMADDLAHALRGKPYRLRLQDVDTREDWRDQYGSRVPVLTLQDGTELCHYHLEPKRLLPYL